VSRILFLEITVEPSLEMLALVALRDLKAQLEARIDVRGAQLLRSTQDSRVILLEVKWSREPPDQLEGWPTPLEAKHRAWSFEVIEGAAAAETLTNWRRSRFEIPTNRASEAGTTTIKLEGLKREEYPRPAIPGSVVPVAASGSAASSTVASSTVASSTVASGVQGAGAGTVLNGKPAVQQQASQPTNGSSSSLTSSASASPIFTSNSSGIMSAGPTTNSPSALQQALQVAPHSSFALGFQRERTIMQAQKPLQVLRESTLMAMAEDLNANQGVAIALLPRFGMEITIDGNQFQVNVAELQTGHDIRLSRDVAQGISEAMKQLVEKIDAHIAAEEKPNNQA
jgi:hypothetical protein